MAAVTVAAVTAGLVVLVAVGTAAAAWVLPARLRPPVSGLGTAATGALGVTLGVLGLRGPAGALSVALPAVLPLSGASFALDALGSLFVLVVSAVAVPVGLYAASYTRGHGLDARLPAAALPLFVLAMVAVPAASGVAALLLAWELMALTSLAVLVAEHRERPEVAGAARWYAVMTHLGFVAVLAGSALLTAHAAGDSFAALRAAEPGPVTAGIVFVAAVAGFGSKAGMVPLHAWLPRAHAEAPSHLSALMSAAMVNLGVYGIVRVGFDLLGGGPTWWWLLLLALGATSALHGILQAAVSTDLKRLLGRSTSENMGLVLIGVGAAGLFAAEGRPELAALALTAAFLHLLAHAAFKTVLFLAAGSVVRATGTRDLDLLGGLRRRMPATTALFGIGALAASALPPGTAFVSEWVLLQALVHGPSGTASTVAMPLAVAAVALTAGLSVATFVKAFGVGFLARPRSAAAQDARESPAPMLVAAGLAALACAVLAWFPGLVLPAVTAAVPGGPAVAGVATLRLTAVTGVLSPALVALALVAGTVATLGVVRWLAGGGRTVREWECGGGAFTARTEYTATSFAEPLHRVFDDVLAPETSVDVDHHDESRYLVASVAFRRAVPDRIERRLYDPVLAGVRRWGLRGRALADGSVHRYLGYGFVGLCAVLVLLVVTA